MLAIVRIALSRPYTFVVMAMLIVIFGVTAAIKTPTDIFPNIGIPVVAVVWTYNGLPPDDMSGRVIYYYERTLSAQVNDIEHIESQSLAGLRRGEGVLPAQRQHQFRARADHRRLADRAEAAARRHHAALRPELQRLERANPPAGVVQQGDVAGEIFDAGQNFIRPQLATVAGSAIPSPYGGKVLQVQVDLNQDKLQAYGFSSQDVVDAIARQNVDHAGRNGESRRVRIYRRSQRRAEPDR